MIIRIFGEGQYQVTDEHLEELNVLDSALQKAVDEGDQEGFTLSLRELLETVRRLGSPLPSDLLAPSELVLPDDDTTLDEVKEILSSEGLIPG
ncbi:PspA-associated protein PspAA [Actinocorallia aurantiaca]|uniref:PspA-associated domain-containing protein n=1 Tax=Actinocorallia aurantiaca TaxID=46204 RepID=A0ABN3U5B6_9ACTN